MMNSKTPDRHHMLHRELCWFMRLRWLAGFVVSLVAMTGLPEAEWLEHDTRILILGLSILAYNLPFWLILRQQQADVDRPEALAVLGWFQILLDLLSLSLLVIWTGGLYSPVLSLFILHMVIASLLLPPAPTAPFIAAALAVVLMAFGLWLTDQWPSDRAAWLIAAGWLLSLLMTGHLTNHITRNLRRHHSALLDQIQQTRGILETAVDGIITIDPQGKIESVNPAAVEMFGYDESEMIGNNVKLLMPEPYRSQHDQYVQDYFRTMDPKIIGIGQEITGRRKNGESFPLDIAVSEVAMGDHKRIFTGIIRDITQRKQHEEELTRLNRERQEQQQALIQHEKMAAMGKMAAGVAHEIANPLANMDSLLQLAMRRPEHLVPETIQVLRQQIDRINQIVKQMTAFAHPTDDHIVTVALNDIIDSALEMVRFDHRIRRVEINRELSTEVGHVAAMPHALQQVLVNLVLNALDALSDTAEPRLFLGTRVENSWCIIEIRDNGSGITMEHLPRIFEPFYTTKPVGEGTGLGLAISYSIIERHGGRLEVQSSPGEGTMFTIYLPRST